VMASNHAQALTEFRRAEEMMPRVPESILIRAYAAKISSGNADALRVMSEFEAVSSQRGVSPFHAAITYEFLERREDALQWLETGYRERHPDMVFVGPIRCSPG